MARRKQSSGQSAVSNSVASTIAPGPVLAEDADDDAPQFHPPPPIPRGALWGDPSLVAWNAFLLIASPYLTYLRIHKVLKNKRWDPFLLRRWTLAGDRAPTRDKPNVLLVCVALGEFRLARALAEALSSESGEWCFTYVVRDPRLRAHLEKSEPNLRCVTMPFDFATPVTKFLRRERPSLVAFIEGCSFPNLVVGSKIAGAKVVLLNGKASKCKVGWGAKPAFIRWLARHFDRLAIQDADAWAGVQENGKRPENPLVTGNLKFSLLPSPPAVERLRELERWVSAAEDLPLVAAGSTERTTEHRFVLEAFKEARSASPCRLLLAPRTPHDALLAAQMAREHGLAVSFRSKGGPPADVMLLDSVGELAWSYRYARAAYVGGALEGNGHNVLEPVSWGLPVAYGPRRGAHAELQLACEEAGIGRQVRSPSELARFWLDSLNVTCVRRELDAARARSVMQSHQAGFTSTVELLREALSEVGVRG